MPGQKFKYVIVGGGLAGASAVEGIREVDRDGTILLLGSEKVLPYNRPPLTKDLWLGKKKLEQIFVHKEKFYEEKGVQLVMGTQATSLDVREKVVFAGDGNPISFTKLLLATGGYPRTLSIPGGDSRAIYYYRYLDDYLRLRPEAGEKKSAVVVGGGFIGSEIAAALNTNKVEVTMIFPSPYLCSRVFPDYLGTALQQLFLERGIRVLSGEKPVGFTRRKDHFITQTERGGQIESDFLIVGVGIAPETKLAGEAGLRTGNGVVVNEYLESSNPDIYAAGDNAFFPYAILGQEMRIEHWDNALAQGKCAGRNMAGAHEAFIYLPYFFSDLFEFGYEAVGEVDSRLQTFADWQEENKRGVIYYLRDGRVRGVMACNVWEKMEAARDLIRKKEAVEPESLRGAIR